MLKDVFGPKMVFDMLQFTHCFWLGCIWRLNLFALYSAVVLTNYMYYYFYNTYTIKKIKPQPIHFPSFSLSLLPNYRRKFCILDPNVEYVNDWVILDRKKLFWHKKGAMGPRKGPRQGSWSEKHSLKRMDARYTFALVLILQQPFKFIVTRLN